MSTSGINSSVVTGQFDSLQASLEQPNTDSQLLSQLLPSTTEATNQDAVSVSVNDLYGSLSVFAKQVFDKLQELLKDQLPNGLDAFKPEDNTPEKTADRIVQGSTAFLPVYAKQHPELQGEELLTEFMKTIRQGIAQGYGEADSILGDIGAYDVEGVKDGIDKTKQLVEEGLKAFEDNYRKQYISNSVSENTATEIEKNAASSAQTAAGQVNVYEIA